MLQLQASSELLIPLVSAFVGGVLAILGNLVLEWYRAWATRRRLRRNLMIEITEIMVNLSALYNMPDELLDEVEDGEWESKVLHPYYDAHRQNIMVLSALEIRKIEQFYTRVDFVHGKIYDTPSPELQPILLSIAITKSLYDDVHEALHSPIFRLKYQAKQLLRSSDEPDISLELPTSMENDSEDSSDNAQTESESE